MVDRRAFLGTLASGVLSSPIASFAQPPAKVNRIGVLGNIESPPWDGFRRGLRELGLVDGRNVTIEWRWSEGKTDRIPDLAREFVQLKVDIIVTSSHEAVWALKQAKSTIPIVMAASANPDQAGLVDSLAHPGGNVTGLSTVAKDLGGKRFQLLKEIAPKVSRVAVLWNPANPIEPLGFRETLKVGAAAGVEIQSIEVGAPDDYPAGFGVIVANRADALHVFGNPVNFANRQLIADFALKNRLPGSFEERLFVESGGLFSYAASLIDLYRRAATYVDKILKGVKPADLPIEQPNKFELVINARTARALGLAIPQSVLAHAPEIIQ